MPAKAARRELDEDLLGVRRVEFELFDLPLLVQAVQDSGLGLHRFTLAEVEPVSVVVHIR
jgi:hypothetical protein